MQMANDLNTEVQPVGPVRTRSSLGYGKGPLVAGVLVAAVLIPVLILGGVGATSAMTAVAPTPASQSQTTAPPTTVPGTAVPGTDAPVTPPDRGSDQTGVPAQADQVYYIQDGDTLTSLSARFGMSIDYIANYNAVRDVNVISEGAVLRVPFIYLPPAAGSPAS
ncbi:LysM peptidoglycan-binding domain-containing protein [Cryobacterium zhongshanensis]|uniref:LysM peptidoglycan-binding domain-containing protein n=1 Tax=Cryobacterium zhongshanensis TaxID=2928153 RepID=A0AA41R2C2_9MICO|nr:LysM peptidoglycan-binding domain-containing protein [Cryobacterium zhongshanensis]MCI4659641.1 LysM peptidoglycan-binding domain-containing protein [Cryobacterium zhongshanensis]